MTALPRDYADASMADRSGILIASGHDLASAFNEWLRRYADEPESYEAESATIERFFNEEDNGEEPSYGGCCVAYLKRLLAEVKH